MPYRPNPHKQVQFNSKVETIPERQYSNQLVQRNDGHSKQMTGKAGQSEDNRGHVVQLVPQPPVHPAVRALHQQATVQSIESDSEDEHGNADNKTPEKKWAYRRCVRDKMSALNQVKHRLKLQDTMSESESESEAIENINEHPTRAARKSLRSFKIPSEDYSSSSENGSPLTRGKMNMVRIKSGIHSTDEKVSDIPGHRVLPNISTRGGSIRVTEAAHGGRGSPLTRRRFHEEACPLSPSSMSNKSFGFETSSNVLKSLPPSSPSPYGHRINDLNMSKGPDSPLLARCRAMDVDSCPSSPSSTSSMSPVLDKFKSFVPTPPSSPKRNRSRIKAMSPSDIKNNDFVPTPPTSPKRNKPVKNNAVISNIDSDAFESEDELIAQIMESPQHRRVVRENKVSPLSLPDVTRTRSVGTPCSSPKSDSAMDFLKVPEVKYGRRRSEVLNRGALRSADLDAMRSALSAESLMAMSEDKSHRMQAWLSGVEEASKGSDSPKTKARRQIIDLSLEQSTPF